MQPDWVYRPAENCFTWRRLRRRPRIALDIVRAAPSAWPLFAPHHYLSAALANSAVCFAASWQDRPVAFSAWLPFVGSGPKTRREHRTVTLPDYQGVGLGNALSDFVASLTLRSTTERFDITLRSSRSRTDSMDSANPSTGEPH